MRLDKNKMRELREARGLSQKELAKLADLSVNYICMIENGKQINVSLQALYKIGQALKVDGKDLII